MDTIPLSMPYFVLSTQQHRDGTRQVHALTPFGCIDISVKLVDDRQPQPFVEVSVQGDLGPWVLDRRMPNAFRDALFQLVGNIALSRNGCSVRRRSRLMVHFKNAYGRLTMTGYLPPPEVEVPLGSVEAPGPPNYQWHRPKEEAANLKPACPPPPLIPDAFATGGG
jgi:hypothetical protein